MNYHFLHKKLMEVFLYPIVPYVHNYLHIFFVFQTFYWKSFLIRVSRISCRKLAAGSLELSIERVERRKGAVVTGA